MNMNIEIFKITNAMVILDKFNKMSCFYPHEFKEFVRLYSTGNGILHLVSNNTGDTKIILNIDIEEGIEFDKVYIIKELNNIVKNLLNYSKVTFIDDGNVDIIHFDDGKFSIASIPLSDQRKEETFGLDDETISYDKTFFVNEVYEEEIQTIFKLLDFRSNTASESYFFHKDCLYFNFKGVYIRKQSNLSFLVTDLFSLRIISIILLSNKLKEVRCTEQDGKILLKSEGFYFETKVYKEDEQTVKFVDSFFNNIETLKIVNMKPEFYNWMEAVNTKDKESTIVFSDEKRVYVQSAKYRNWEAEFNIDLYDGNTFVIPTEDLHKILKYVNSEIKPDKLKFETINSNSSNFLYYGCKDDTIKIISEIM